MNHRNLQQSTGVVDHRDRVQGALSPQLVAMVRRVPPTGAPVVPGSVPVVAFGDPERAEVASLGINPSHREFVENGVLLCGQHRRLATLESLGATRIDRLTDGQVADVVADCAAYFQRNPYRRWFDRSTACSVRAPAAASTTGPHATSIWSSGPPTRPGSNASVAAAATARARA